MLNGIVAIVGNIPHNSESLGKQIADTMEKRGHQGSAMISTEAVLENAQSDSSGKYFISYEGNMWEDSNPSQTIMDLYKKHGPKSVSLLNGDFAFCLWDSEKNKLLAARDRFGIKPLYYINNNNFAVFASQTNALLMEGFPRETNKKLICDFLLHGTQHYRNGETFFEGISELLPGHLIYYNPKLEQISQERYWFPSTPTVQKGSRQEFVNGFLEIFQEKIEKMIPQSKYATSVSGGLDSTIIASMIKNMDCSKKQNMYSVVFEGASYEEAEAPYIKDYENFVKGEINYVVVPLPPSWRSIEAFAQQCTEPNPLLSLYIHWTIALQLQQQEVNTIFTGMAADAFLMGMNSERMNFVASLWKQKQVRRFITELLGMTVNNDYSNFSVKQFLSSVKDFFVRPIEMNHTSLLNSEFIRENNKRGQSIFSSHMLDITGFMQYADRVYASQGIEPIHPFLDIEFSDYLASLPSDMKLHHGESKYVLRLAAKGLIPESIRRSKRKFASSFPLAKWLIAWKPHILKMLNSLEFRSRGYYNSNRITEMYNKLVNNQLEPLECRWFTVMLWCIISLELWQKIYIDKPMVED